MDSNSQPLKLDDLMEHLQPDTDQAVQDRSGNRGARRKEAALSRKDLLADLRRVRQDASY